MPARALAAPGSAPLAPHKRVYARLRRAMRGERAAEKERACASGADPPNPSSTDPSDPAIWRLLRA